MLNPPASTAKKSKWSINWREVRVLYSREMRGALRERAIVLNSILIPVFLYPFLLWAAFTAVQTSGILARGMANALIREVKAIDANLAPDEVITMKEEIARKNWSQGAAVNLLAIFGSGSELYSNVMADG